MGASCCPGAMLERLAPMGRPYGDFLRALALFADRDLIASARSCCHGCKDHLWRRPCRNEAFTLFNARQDLPRHCGD